MTILYVTTDEEEVRILARSQLSKVYKQAELHPIDMHRGEQLKGEIGFSPMTSISVNGDTDQKDLEAVAEALSSHDHYVAIVRNGKVDYFIKDEYVLRDIRDPHRDEDLDDGMRGGDPNNKHEPRVWEDQWTAGIDFMTNRKQRIDSFGRKSIY